MDNLALRIDGNIYKGWKSAIVELDLEAVSASFKVDYFDRWTSEKKTSPIKKGAQCIISADEEILVRGYIETLEGTLTREESTDSFSGRELTGDLVDCSAELKGGEFNGKTLFQIAETLSSPFGLGAFAEVDKFPEDLGPPFEKFKINPGESVYEAIERAARQRSILVSSNGQGLVLLTKPGAKEYQFTISEEAPVISVSYTLDDSDRYSAYTVLSQRGGEFTASHESKSKNQVKGTATDSKITRKRPLVIVAENQVDNKQAKVRAEWEAKVRAARSEQVQITVEGWRNPSGSVWRPNNILRIKLPSKGIDSKMLITKASFSYDQESGSTTALSLMNKEAFRTISLEPVKGN